MSKKTHFHENVFPQNFQIYSIKFNISTIVGIEAILVSFR